MPGQKLLDERDAALTALLVAEGSLHPVDSAPDGLVPDDAVYELGQRRGVDVVGTMLDLELPRLRADIRRIQQRLDHLGAPMPQAQRPTDATDVTAILTEIRELLEAQERRIAALDLRLSRLASDMAEQAGKPEREDA